MRTSCIRSGYDVRPPVLECEEVLCVSIERYDTHELHTKWPRGEARRPRLRVRGGKVFVFELSGTHELHTVVCTV